MKNNYTEDILATIQSINKKKDTWSYLTSIDYMLSSRIYVDTLVSDANLVVSSAKTNSRVLDFGTGSGIFAVLLRRYGNKLNIFGLDTTKDESQKDPNFRDTSKQQKLLWKELDGKHGINLLHYDGKKIPFPANHFDMITAYAVLEHIDPLKWSGIINELNRILKKKGLIFLFKTPRRLALAEYIGGLLRIGRHDLLYSRSEVKNAFAQGGFKLVKTWKSDMVFEFPGSLTNKLYRPLKLANSLLLMSPFRIFAHHNNFIFQKR